MCCLSYKDRPKKVWGWSHGFYNDLLSANQHYHALVEMRIVDNEALLGVMNQHEEDNNRC